MIPRIALLALSATIATTAQSQVLSDDFSDGNDAGWSRHFFGTNYSDRWTVVSGEYRHNSLSPAANDGSSFMLSVWVDSDLNPSLYHDGTLRAKVRIMNEGVSAGVFLRSDIDWFAYCFVMSSALDTVRLEAYPREGPSVLLGETPVPGGIEVGAAYRLAASTIGPWVSLKFWRDGDAEPQEPQLRFRDDRLPSGILGLYSYVSAHAAGPTRIDTRFDDVTFTAQTPCLADYNGDGFLDGFDYDDFCTSFETGSGPADFNNDGFVDGFDYDDFVQAFEQGC